MRSADYLLQLYPEKTGAEILEIQVKEKQAYLKAEEKKHKKKLEFIEDINTNGGFFKGAFSTNQYFMYNIQKVSLQGGLMIAKVETILCFYSKDLKTSKDKLDFEIKQDEHENLDTYSLHNEKRITKEEYYKVYDTLNTIVPVFWELDFKLRQKEFGKH